MISGKGSNSARIRQYNERAVLTQMRRLGTATKREIAEAAGLSPQAVVAIVDGLMRRKLVRKEGRRVGGVGQPSLTYAINPGGAYSIGVKIGRRSLDMLLVDFDGSIIHHIRETYGLPVPGDVWALIDRSLPELIGRLGPDNRLRLCGIGAVAPSFMWEWGKELGMPNEISQQWRGADLLGELRRLTSWPVYTERNGPAAAIAELAFGMGKNLQNFLYVFVGTFVAGGLILHGSYEAGIHGNAGSIASLPVPPSTLDSAPRSEGPFEVLLNRASINSLLRHLRHHGHDHASTSDLWQSSGQVQRLVQEWMDDCAEALAHAILTVIGVVDIEAVIIGGEMPRSVAEAIVGAASDRINTNPQPGVYLPDITSGTLGTEAVAIGAAILPFHAIFGPAPSSLLAGGSEKQDPLHVSPLAPHAPAWTQGR